MNKRGFTIVEMLVVMGIIAVLAAASLVAYDKVRATAERARCSELVSQVETAMTALFEADGHWPKVIREAARGHRRVDEKVAGQLAGRNLISLSHSGMVCSGADRFGVLTPWARDVVKRTKNPTLETVVSRTKTSVVTVEDNIFYFGVDLDGDGIVNNLRVSEVGGTINVRATVAVWCIGKSGGKDGKPWPYAQSLRKDDVHSWAAGHAREIEEE